MTEKNSENLSNKRRYAGLFRRLFAIFYDAFLLTAILLILAAIVMTLNQGKAIETSDNFQPFYAIFMLGICYLYFSWFWINGGQTLGMKTWQIKMVSSDGRPVNWKTTSLRFVTAIVSWGFAALGFLWALFDSKRRCWHDLVSHTELIDLRKKK